MAAKKSFILQQKNTLTGLGRTVLATLKQQITGPPDVDPSSVVGERVKMTIDPPSRELVEAYVAHVGGDPQNYRDHIPPHLFSQWTFDAASKLLVGVPYPLLRTMNGGCRMEINDKLPYDTPLQLTATLEDIDDNGRRAVLHQKFVTEVPGRPEAVVAHLYAIVPLKRSKGGKNKKEKPGVPEDAREVQRWSLKANAGLDFAVLTGDFNLIHWLTPVAKASGFDNTILHGFSTMSRAYEGLKHRVVGKDATISMMDVQFTRPLVLPADVGFYEKDRQIWVADGPGDKPYMKGEYETL